MSDDDRSRLGTDALIPRVRIPLADDYEIDTDHDRLDLRQVHEWLSTDAFWAIGRPFDVVRRAAAASVNFGVYAPTGAQVGYARLVTDGVTFGWLCDVYVAPEARGLGLGKALASAVVDATRPLGLKRVMLSTLDAHQLYARVGFEPFPDPDRLMVIGAS